MLFLHRVISRRAVISGIAGVLGIFAASGGRAWGLAGVVDQSCVIVPAGSLTARVVDARFSEGQTFKVGMNGVLTGVELQVWRGSGTSQPLSVEIRPVDPTHSTVLTSATVQAIQIPQGSGFPGTPAFVSVDLSAAQLQVHTGDILAIVLTTNDPPDQFLTTGYAWASTHQGVNGYANGESWSYDSANFTTWFPLNGQTSGTDQSFRTYVQPVPETATLMVLAAGGSILLGRRRVRGFGSATIRSN